MLDALDVIYIVAALLVAACYGARQAREAGSVVLWFGASALLGVAVVTLAGYGV